MTELLEKALDRVQALPVETQDAIAAQILELIDDEESWARSFAANREKLERLADEAIEEHRHGLTRPIEELFDE